jgi:outer membrane protein insertion porin family
MRSLSVLLGRLVLILGLALPLAFALQAVPARAQVVTEILVEGNQRVEDSAVLSYMHISQGEEFSADKIDESIKALFQTGLFADVRMFRRGNSLVVQVEENPLINKVGFEGNSELGDDKLVKEIELRERMVFTRSRVQSDVQRLIALYRRSGYFAVRIEPKIIRLSQNRVNLVFEIDEGKATKIERINFVGNVAFSDGQLRSAISTAESAWWKFFSTTDNYDPDRIAYDKELLRRYYLKNGFADFRVISATAELARDGESFFITFTVEEGPQYSLGQISVNTGQTTLETEKLVSVVNLTTGQRYDANKVDKAVENITIEAGKSGYAFARVEPDVQRDEANRTLSLTFNIQEGPRVYIERIDIVGNFRTLDEVIRRELRLAEGDAYNRILIDRARRRLTALDFFEKIDFQETPGSAADKVIIIIEVVEKSTGTISFAAGYSSTEQVIGSISITERNLLGRGQFVRLSTSLSFKRQSIDFSFTEPYFMGRNVAAGIDIYATRTDQQSESSFTTQQYGGALRTGFALTEFQRIEPKYSFTHRIIDVEDPTTVSPTIASAAGTDNISMLGIRYIYDDLDNPLRPTSGFRFESSTELAGLGGDVHWVRGEVTAYYFMPLLFEGVVLKVEGSAGHIQGWNGEDVPVIDRFFKGGDSFRGFARAEVGPHQSNPVSGDQDSIGGQTFAIGTLEMTFPVGLPEEFGLEGAVFTDFGTVFNVPEDTIKAGKNGCPGAPNTDPCVVTDSAALRASVGAGVIWQSPFGPLRVDVAYAFLKASTDKTELVRFSVGTRF